MLVNFEIAQKGSCPACGDRMSEVDASGVAGFPASLEIGDPRLACGYRRPQWPFEDSRIEQFAWSLPLDADTVSAGVKIPT